MVKLLPMSTTVLNPPSTMSSSRLASAHASGIPDAVEHVGQEQAAEEQHLGDEEQPHPERRRFVLLLQRVEVVLEIVDDGRVRAVRTGVRGDGVRQL